MNDLGFFGSMLRYSDEELKSLYKKFEEYWKARNGYSYKEWFSQQGAGPDVDHWEMFAVGYSMGKRHV